LLLSPIRICAGSLLKEAVAELTWWLYLPAPYVQTMYTSIAAIGAARDWSAIHYLMTNFEFGFLVVRLSFAIGIIGFIGSLLCRTWLHFTADSEIGDKVSAMAVSSVFISAGEACRG
jgi:hypothetical protein